MFGLAGMAGMPDVRSRRAFFDCDIVCQTQPLEMELQCAPDFYFSGTRPVCTWYSHFITDTYATTMRSDRLTC